MSVATRIGIPRLLAVFTAISLFAATMSWLFTLRTGTSLWSLQADASATMSYVVVMNLLYWVSWAPLAVLVLGFTARHPIDATRWRASVPVHFAVGLAVASIHITFVATARTLLQRSIGMDVSWEERWWDMFFRTLDWELTIYWGLVALQHAADYYNELRERDVRQAQLETRLVEAQLQALQRQLHPHFLFNTLHAISALVHRDPDRADVMIEHLSDLLRMTLDKVGTQEVPLAEELEHLKAYLDIEQVHFGDRLEIVYRIDAYAVEALVPNLVLQPLAENAIRHGLEPFAGRGRLTIEATRQAGRLLIHVVDDGCGMSDEALTRTEHGVGLSNTRTRLERLYGADATLRLSRNSPHGLTATLDVPFRTRGGDENTGARRRRSTDRTRPHCVAAV